MKRAGTQRSEKSSSGRRKTDLTLTRVRSAISNGSRLFGGDVDARGSWHRRFRDLLADHISDLGGEGALSAGQKALARRAAMMELQLEMMESNWARDRDGEASPRQIERYQRVASALRRIIESLDLNRGRQSRDVTGEVLNALRSNGHYEVAP